MTRTYITIGIISLIAIAALIFGFSIVGSPSDIRAKEFDKTRLSNISYLKSQIETYYNTNYALPYNLSDLSSSSYSSYYKNYTKDPETKKDFEYTKTNNTSYKLCTAFGAPSNIATDTSYYDFDTTHPKGNYCFKFTVKALKKTTSPTIYQTPIQ